MNAPPLPPPTTGGFDLASYADAIVGGAVGIVTAAFTWMGLARRAGHRDGSIEEWRKAIDEDLRALSQRIDEQDARIDEMREVQTANHLENVKTMGKIDTTLAMVTGVMLTKDDRNRIEDKIDGVQREMRDTLARIETSVANGHRVAPSGRHI